MKKKPIDWALEQKRFNKENLKKRISLKDYCIKYKLNYGRAQHKMKVRKATEKVQNFLDKKEEITLKKKPNSKEKPRQSQILTLNRNSINMPLTLTKRTNII